MRTLLKYLPLLLSVAACDTATETGKPQAQLGNEVSASGSKDFLHEVRSSLVRINATQQEWSAWQPWEKNPPTQRRALAAVIGDQQVITTAELAANATYLEFESADGTGFIPAMVIARDDEANLALLGPADQTQGNEFFKNTVPLELADPVELGETLQILQLEANGVALLTDGTLQSVDLARGFLPNHHFLTYMVKASMQSAASSYSLPVLHGRKLAGVLTGYNSKDQICDVASTDIVTRFINEAKNKQYVGFPSLGVQVAVTEDTSFRQWLKLTDDQGGLYIQSVRKGASAEQAGIKNGDVILSVDGHPIDRSGYYDHPRYGSLLWAHLIRGEKSVGDPLTLTILRDGQEIEITATLSREEEREKLVPSQLIDQAPNYLVKGGLIFQELTRTILESYGKEWTSRAPLNLLDAYENPEKYQDRMNRIVFLSAVIPTPATIGYEQLRSLIVSKVNGHEVQDMKSLMEAFNSKSGMLHSIEFVDENLVVYIDDQISNAVDKQLLKRGIAKLYHVGPTTPQDE